MSIILENSAARAVSAQASWSEISREQLPYWNDLLLRSAASVHQYPFWNEPYESLYFSPRHLVWGRHNDAQAYASILTVGFRGFRVGLVFRGPANLKGSGPVAPEAIAALSEWASHEGYVFLRLTPQDEPNFNAAAAVSGARCADFFPFYLDFGQKAPDLVVEQKESDDAMLASFDREARRKIRRAVESKCEIRISDSAQALAEVWPLYAQCVQRKGFRLERPLSFYVSLVRAARCHEAVRVYSAWRDGRPCAMTLVVRDRDTAHCLLAAHDDEETKAGISTLLHWTSMRHMYDMGAGFYNMGPAPGSLARYKQQFSPRAVSYPGAVTLVADEKRFRLWQTALLPLAKAVRPSVRKLSGKFYQKNSRVAARNLSVGSSIPEQVSAAVRRTA
jgi:lipid II:glycine glycyltransferase (peptidoglycan interpeptide bridge formation enzyme)